jgi:predicted methyltransferase
MIRFNMRQLAATVILAASASLAPSIAGEAAAPAVPYASKPYTIPAKGVSDAVRKAVQSPDRPANHVERDGWRRPAEILTLANVKPGSRVVELSPYGLYYSTLLSSVVGEKGTVHMYEFPHVAEVYGETNKAWAAKHPNVKYEVVDYGKIEFPRNVDVVFSSLAFHDMLLLNVDMDVFHDKLFKAMKPGAFYLVIDHSAQIGTGTNDTGKLHRIDPQVVRAQVGAYGFQLVEDSRLLENVQDDHKWPVFEEGKRDQTDQLVYKFRKPVVY